MVEKSRIRKAYARHRTCGSLPRTYTDVKTAELTPYVIQEVLPENRIDLYGEKANVSRSYSSFLINSYSARPRCNTTE